MKTISAEEFEGTRGKPLRDDDRFAFDCHPDLDCFNRCCRNLNLFLYPYDVARLKRNLGISAGLFIDRYVDVVMRRDNFFPDVLLTMSDNEEKSCPFLTPRGCSVYPDRSYSCRMFPVEQGLIYDNEGKRPQPVNFFRPPDFCLGRHEKRMLTITDWVEDQEAFVYDEMTRLWAEIKGRFVDDPWGGEGASGHKARMAFMAVYNTDEFRKFIFNSSFLKRFRVKPKVLKKIRASDRELIQFGFEYIKVFVWGEKTMSLRPA